MRTSSFVAALLLGACQGSGELTVVDPSADGGPQPTGTGAGTGTGTGTGTGGGGQCGDVLYWDMVLSGSVLAPNGAPAAFAEVRLEDRGWNPSVTVMGNAVANAQGDFVMDLPQIIDVEDCWGSVLDYVLVGQLGPTYGERGINSSLYSAILDQSLAADIGDLQLEP